MECGLYNGECEFHSPSILLAIRYGKSSKQKKKMAKEKNSTRKSHKHKPKVRIREIRKGGRGKWKVTSDSLVFLDSWKILFSFPQDLAVFLFLPLELYIAGIRR